MAVLNNTIYYIYVYVITAIVRCINIFLLNAVSWLDGNWCGYHWNIYYCYPKHKLVKYIYLLHIVHSNSFFKWFDTLNFDSYKIGVVYFDEAKYVFKKYFWVSKYTQMVKDLELTCAHYYK